MLARGCCPAAQGAPPALEGPSQAGTSSSAADSSGAECRGTPAPCEATAEGSAAQPRCAKHRTHIRATRALTLTTQERSAACPATHSIHTSRAGAQAGSRTASAPTARAAPASDRAECNTRGHVLRRRQAAVHTSIRTHPARAPRPPLRRRRGLEERALRPQHRLARPADRPPRAPAGAPLRRQLRAGGAGPEPAALCAGDRRARPPPLRVQAARALALPLLPLQAPCLPPLFSGLAGRPEPGPGSRSGWPGRHPTGRSPQPAARRPRLPATGHQSQTPRRLRRPRRQKTRRPLRRPLPPASYDMTRRGHSSHALLAQEPQAAPVGSSEAAVLSWAGPRARKRSPAAPPACAPRLLRAPRGRSGVARARRPRRRGALPPRTPRGPPRRQSRGLQGRRQTHHHLLRRAATRGRGAAIPHGRRRAPAPASRSSAGAPASTSAPRWAQRSPCVCNTERQGNQKELWRVPHSVALRVGRIQESYSAECSPGRGRACAAPVSGRGGALSAARTARARGHAGQCPASSLRSASSCTIDRICAGGACAQMPRGPAFPVSGGGLSERGGQPGTVCAVPPRSKHRAALFASVRTHQCNLQTCLSFFVLAG